MLKLLNGPEVDRVDFPQQEQKVPGEEDDNPRQ